MPYLKRVFIQKSGLQIQDYFQYVLNPKKFYFQNVLQSIKFYRDYSLVNNIEEFLLAIKIQLI